jgi:hypothetical protein
MEQHAVQRCSSAVLVVHDAHATAGCSDGNDRPSKREKPPPGWNANASSGLDRGRTRPMAMRKVSSSTTVAMSATTISGTSLTTADHRSE